ncbi:MAG: sugar transferase [Candidatus Colwellbacteria bacterium]|nr:sugar transferase [Candidatus Colwellbacteria bacterium]
MSYPVWKRITDISGGLIGLLILIILTPFIGLAIKLDTPGEIIVKLDRVSRGRTVRVYKFRSMVKGADKMKNNLLALNERNDGPFFKMKNDPRVTRVGRVLRRFRIDELPQLINVLKGDLALVGPRPHEPGEVIYYPGEYKNLIMARAGVTGLSQVSGASGLPAARELELDQFYLDNISLGLDFKIILRTFAILFFDPTAV